MHNFKTPKLNWDIQDIHFSMKTHPFYFTGNPAHFCVHENKLGDSIGNYNIITMGMHLFKQKKVPGKKKSGIRRDKNNIALSQPRYHLDCDSTWRSLSSTRILL